MGTLTKISDFPVDTNGHCFICLSKSSPQFKSDGLGLGSPKPYSSAHALSRYLKMDLSKVFNEKEAIPSSLLESVKRSKLKVSLCEQCSKWNNKIGELCRQLKKIETEVTFYLELVQVGLSRSSHGIKTDLIYKMGDLDASSNSGVLEKVRIVKALRTEAMQRCSHTLKTANQPRIKVQKLTANQIDSKKERMYTTKRKPDAGNLSNARISFWDGNHIRTEDSDRNDYFGIDGDPEDMDYSNRNPEDKLNNTVAWKEVHLNIRQTESTSVNYEKRKWQNMPVVTSSEKVLPPTSLTKEVEKLTFTINPETGKYNCNICSLDAPTKSLLNIHYESVHLKIKHKCNLCGKEFSKKSNYAAHHRTAHVGVRFKCTSCDKCFTEKRNLFKHQHLVHSVLSGNR